MVSGVLCWGVWGGTARSGACILRRCTRSVSITPFLIGCSAPQRVQCPATGAVPRNGSAAYSVSTER